MFAVIAGVSFGGWAAVKFLKNSRARLDIQCRALADALDKTVRERSPRIYEGIVEHRYDLESSRCLAALEYHYRPCDAKARVASPALCAGPDADVAIFAFQNAGAVPLFLCERTYAPELSKCTESVYGSDGALLISREFPPEQFLAIKAEKLGAKP